MELVKSNLAGRHKQFAEFLDHAAGLNVPEVRRMMISALLIQLYSAVESTIVLILGDVAKIAATQRPVHFTKKLRREWLRTIAGTHKDLNYGNRLDNVEKVVRAIEGNAPTGEFEIEKGGGGNWNYNAIADICERLGFKVQLTPELKTSLLRHVHDELGILEFVMVTRNKLSHGNLTFSEAAGEFTCQEILNMGNTIFEYLEVVINSSQTFLENGAFVRAAS